VHPGQAGGGTLHREHSDMRISCQAIGSGSSLTKSSNVCKLQCSGGNAKKSKSLCDLFSNTCQVSFAFCSLSLCFQQLVRIDLHLSMKISLLTPLFSSLQTCRGDLDRAAGRRRGVRSGGRLGPRGHCRRGCGVRWNVGSWRDKRPARRGGRRAGPQTFAGT